MDGEYLVDDLVEDVVYLGELEDLPDVTTVGGLIISKLGRPPEVGDQVTYSEDNVRLKVLAIEGRAVTRVRLEYPVSREESVAGDSDQANSEDASQTLNLIEQIRERRKKWDSS